MNRSLALLLVLSGVAGCAQKPKSSSATLSVTRGFALANGSFAGGLLLTGVNDKKETFSRSLKSGDTINLDLPKSTWTISAVAFDGQYPEAPKLFAGVPLCGTVKKTLVNDSETIDLTVDQETCQRTEFSARQEFVDVSLKTLKKLRFINTCSTFFNKADPDTVVRDAIINSSTPNNFCDDMNLPEDLRSTVKGFRIRSLDKDLASGFKPALDTGCLPTITSYTDLVSPTVSYSNYDLRLPYNTIPFMVETFADNTCNKRLADYPFKRGIAANYKEDFDHLVHATSSSHARLWLPGTEKRRAMSPFFAHMPYILSNDEELETTSFFPVTPVSSDYYFQAPLGTSKIIIKEPECNVDALLNVSSVECRDLGESIEVTVNITKTPGKIKNFNNTYEIHAESGPAPQNRWEVLKIANDLLGHSNPHPKVRSLLKPDHRNLQDHGRAFGALAQARYWLGPKGAGGLFHYDELFLNQATTFKELCHSLKSEKNFQIYNPLKMTVEAGFVQLTDGPRFAPESFTCSNEDVAPADCEDGVIFDKRLVLFNYVNSVMQPTVAIEFSCDQLIGRIQSSSIDVQGLVRHKYDEVTDWNTQMVNAFSQQRFEQLTISTVDERNGTNWVQKEARRTMSQLYKEGTDNWAGRHYEYKGTKTTTSWNERIVSYEMLSQNSINIAYAKADAASNTSEQYAIFEEDIADDTPPSQAQRAFTPSSPFPMSANPSSISITRPTNLTAIMGLPLQLNSLASEDFTNRFDSNVLASP